MNYYLFIDRDTGVIREARGEPASPANIPQSTEDYLVVAVPETTFSGIGVEKYVTQYTYNFSDSSFKDNGARPGPYATLTHSGGWVTDTANLMIALRQVRDILLADTDRHHLNDHSLTPEQNTASVTYRQALRDFPATVDLTGKHDLSDVVFPTKPTYP